MEAEGQLRAPEAVQRVASELARRTARKVVVWGVATFGWLPVLIVILLLVVDLMLGWLVRTRSPLIRTDPVAKAILPEDFPEKLAAASASTIGVSAPGAEEFRVPEAVIGGVWVAAWQKQPRPDVREIGQLLKPDFTTQTWTLTTTETCRVCSDGGCTTVTRRWTREEVRPVRVVSYDGITEIDWRVERVTTESGDCTTVSEELVEADRRFRPDNSKFRAAFARLGLDPFEEYVYLYQWFYQGYTEGPDSLPPMYDPGQSPEAVAVYEGPIPPVGPWAWPVPSSRRVTDGFGWRTHPITGARQFHAGVDIAAGMGEAVVSADDGQVTYVGYAGGYGLRVEVAHKQGTFSTYNHLSAAAVGSGQPVRRGQVVGRVGSTGLSTGPHLHFEARVGNAVFDPMRVLEG